MRELTDIVAAFTQLCAAWKPSALATVIAVDGSAYRRPGARMLIAEDGRTWGGVSGGCLERDVAARGRGVIASGAALVCRYDSTDDELISRGVSTGCGGTIDVLLQPLSAERPGPFPLFAATLADDMPRRVATVVRAGSEWRSNVGRVFDLDRISDTAAAHDDDATFLRLLVAAGGSTGGRIEWNGDWAELFVSVVTAPQRLMLVGGGPDVVPVVTIAKALGWRVAVVAAPPATALFERFAAADERYVTAADAPLAGVPLTPGDAVIVMTHNLARDAAVLAAMSVTPRYLGVLGPRHRSDRLVATLPAIHPARSLHSPVGLELGGNTPEEIALSIIAGVQAALQSASGRPLDQRSSVTSADATFADALPQHPKSSPATRSASRQPNESMPSDQTTRHFAELA